MSCWIKSPPQPSPALLQAIANAETDYQKALEALDNKEGEKRQGNDDKEDQPAG